MAGTDDLVDWLRLQLDEDERGVREWTRPRADGLLTSSLRDIHEWTERAGPARVLREVEARRRLIELMAAQLKAAEVLPAGHRVAAAARANGALCLLALPYSDRPGFREEWRA